LTAIRRQSDDLAARPGKSAAPVTFGGS
jgi:hypothetical protein